MALRTAEELSLLLKQGKPLPAVFISGEDAFLRESYREQLIESAVEPAARQWAVERYSAADDDIPAIVGRARMMPMMTQRQVIVLSEIDEIDGGDPDDAEAGGGRSMREPPKSEAPKILEEYLNEPAPYTLLVLEAAKLDKRTRLSKLLAQTVPEVVAELPEEPGARLSAATRHCKQMAARENSAIEDEAAAELADLCNCDLAQIHTELQKLLTYAGGGGPIRTADVRMLVVSEKKYTVWELAEVMAAGDVPGALKFLDKLIRDGEELPAMVGAMAWMFRKLLEARDLPPRSAGWEAAAKLQMRPHQAEQAVRQAHRISREQLVRAMEALYQADSRLKSGAKDQRAIMEFLVAEITRQRTAARTMREPGGPGGKRQAQAF